MNPFLFTTTFLTLIGILTSSELVHYTYEAQNEHLFNGHLIANFEREKIIQTSYFEEFKQKANENPKPRKPSEKSKSPSSEKKSSAPLNYNHKRPPNNSRLNFYLLLNNERGFHYETAATLMRNLYGKMEFFNALPNAECEILDALIAKKDETTNFTYPDELATIDLGNKELQTIFVALLKGGEDYPSLLHYITFDKKGSSYQMKINFMFAPAELIYAICPKSPLATSLLYLQAETWSDIDFQEQNRKELENCKGRMELKRELTNAFTAHVREADINTEAFLDLFDFSLGKPGNILFIKDKASGITLREKYIKKTRR